MEKGKSVSDAAQFVALGVRVETDTTNSCLKFSAPEHKVDKWLLEIEAILGSGHLPPATARQLAGKLGWGGSVVSGKGATVHLAPLYYHASMNFTLLSWRL